MLSQVVTNRAFSVPDSSKRNTTEEAKVRTGSGHSAACVTAQRLADTR
jgi:hypothetical protein